MWLMLTRSKENKEDKGGKFLLDSDTVEYFESDVENEGCIAMLNRGDVMLEIEEPIEKVAAMLGKVTGP